MSDLGCGPGQTTKFLYDCGVKDITGIDISPRMIKIASRINPHLKYETADMLDLKYDDNAFGSAIAFYSIVNLDLFQIGTAFREIRRVLKTDGEFLLSFHIGNKTVHLENLLDKKVNIDFHFFRTKTISKLLSGTGFKIIDILEREPYIDAEYPSRRAYVWVKK